MALLVAYASEAMARLRGTDTVITVEGIHTLQDRSTHSAAKAKCEVGISIRPLEDTLRDEVIWYRTNQPEKIKTSTAHLQTAKA